MSYTATFRRGLGKGELLSHIKKALKRLDCRVWVVNPTTAVIHVKPRYTDIETTKDIIWELLLKEFDASIETDSDIEVTINY